MYCLKWLETSLNNDYFDFLISEGSFDNKFNNG